ncbi:hypothetical protein [Actinokineospora inagensis]|nr:hypothetical protein [Actinokineospora inagensis]
MTLFDELVAQVDGIEAHTGIRFLIRNRHAKYSRRLTGSSITSESAPC